MGNVNVLSNKIDELTGLVRREVGVEDAVLYLLHRALSYLDVGESTVRVLFLDFLSAFNTIQPHLLQEKLNSMAVDPHLVRWTITDYLTNRPQLVRIGSCRSSILINSPGYYAFAPPLHPLTSNTAQIHATCRNSLMTPQ